MIKNVTLDPHSTMNALCQLELSLGQAIPLYSPQTIYLAMDFWLWV